MANPLSLLPLRQSLQSIVNAVLGITLVIMITVVQGCGGGGSSNNSNASNNLGSSAPPPVSGDLFIGITDAEGDFLNYEVTLQAITLVRANGDVVETLPLSTRIDFTELTEITELLTIATVPEGVYESVIVRMDFSDAQIVVQDQNGSSLIANPVDLNGDPLGVTDIRLQLTTSDVIRISAGIPAAFSLDFDLAASNEIDLLTSPPTVVVEPFLLATPELETNREHRVRGVLVEVDVAAGEVDLMVRPFRHRTGQFGQFLLNVNDDTQYEIDGQGYTGGAGLDALALLNENTPVIANGNIAAAGMMAHTVLAGSSVPWSDADVVVGVVSARAGEVLSVQGAHVEFADGTRIYRGNFSINLTDMTSVSAPGVDNADITTQSISVGQRVVAWGEFADDETLVASRVRMQMNQLTAQVVQASPLAVDLYFLNTRRLDIFDFSGTGATSGQDADADFYQIETGLLPLANIVDGDLVRIRGLVNAFGTAPADYLARSVIDVETDVRSALLKVGWQQGTNSPFVAIVADRIDVDLTEARKALSVRGVPSEFIDLMDDITLIAPDSGRGVYAVKVRGSGQLHLFRSFNDLVDELVAQLDAGNLLHRITVQGAYNVGDAELTTRRAGFVFSSINAQ